jgi:hypothetical protein
MTTMTYYRQSTEMHPSLHSEYIAQRVDLDKKTTRQGRHAPACRFAHIMALTRRFSLKSHT